MGAKCATILLLGRPGDQNRLTKERVTKTKKQVGFGGSREKQPITLGVVPGHVFLHSFFHGFSVPRRPPGGVSAAGAGTLWGCGNIALGPLEDDITMCF